MTKQAIVFTWGDGKKLGYSKIDGETEWTMDMPGVPRNMAKIMNLKASDESIEKMIKEMKTNGGEVHRFEVEEEKKQ